MSRIGNSNRCTHGFFFPCNNYCAEEENPPQANAAPKESPKEEGPASRESVQSRRAKLAMSIVNYVCENTGASVKVRQELNDRLFAWAEHQLEEYAAFRADLAEGAREKPGSNPSAEALLITMLREWDHQNENDRTWYMAKSEEERRKDMAEDFATRLAAIPPIPPAPIPMVLHCPECKARHIDEGEFATKPHHTHSCQSCGLTWRPSVVSTVGVQFLPGFKNEPATAPSIAGGAALRVHAVKGDKYEGMGGPDYFTDLKFSDGFSWRTLLREPYSDTLCAALAPQPEVAGEAETAGSGNYGPLEYCVCGHERERHSTTSPGGNDFCTQCEPRGCNRFRPAPQPETAPSATSDEIEKAYLLGYKSASLDGPKDPISAVRYITEQRKLHTALKIGPQGDTPTPTTVDICNQAAAWAVAEEQAKRAAPGAGEKGSAS